MRGVIAWHPRHVEVVARRQRSSGDKTAHGIGGDGNLRVSGVGNGEMEIAPVDAQIVARAVQNALLARARVEHGERGNAAPPPRHFFIARVYGDQRIHVDEERNVVRALAGRRKREIRDRPRKQIEIFGKGRREKCDRQSDLRGLERVDGARGRDFKRSLLHGRRGARHRAHESVRLPVNPRQARDRLRSARPVFSVLVGKTIGHGPYAEIRSVRDERNRRRPLLRGSKSGSKDGCGGEQA